MVGEFATQITGAGMWGRLSGRAMARRTGCERLDKRIAERPERRA
ncbi:hypothetical protein ACFFSY_06940 [Paenibacillus aurantiacus]|uniref:Uncharacterized protein n=1 Tax=Paenibacillus aurantiacus TaxID=1936118 RepID=A0ABV5KNG2_9BACL